MSAGRAFDDLLLVMHRLRSPGGCPWDVEQTHHSLKPYLIEEAYEVIEAIDLGDDKDLSLELGDLLLQIVFHAEIASGEGRFSILDVIRNIHDKMVRRHPHVFGDTVVSGTGEVLKNWSRIKAKEREGREDQSALAGVPRAMPALLRAQRLGEKAEHTGFDWTEMSEVMAKMREEFHELEAALQSRSQEAAAAELGDVLLTATSLARHLGVRAEDTLHGAADRFSRRFRRMEENLASDDRVIRELRATELEEAWQTAKRQLDP
jgi:tetrapyrrole methylase family protein/MazG family protein